MIHDIDDRLSDLICRATGPSFEEQWLVSVESALISRVVKREVSVTTLFESSDGTVQLRPLLHKSLRRVCAASAHQIVLRMALCSRHQTHAHQRRCNDK